MSKPQGYHIVGYKRRRYILFSGSRKCFKCTSWTTTYCTQRTSLSVAMQYFPLVWCSGSCITRAIEHDDVTVK